MSQYDFRGITLKNSEIKVNQNKRGIKMKVEKMLGLMESEFVNSKNVKLKMVISYRLEDNNYIVSFYSPSDNHIYTDYLISRYQMKTLINVKGGLCLEGTNSDAYFVDDDQMSKFIKVFKMFNLEDVWL